VGSTEEISLGGSTGGDGPLNVVVADLNNDGNQDIAIANYHSNTVQIIFGRGDGTFDSPPVTVPVGHRPSSIVAKDVNGDGLIDLIVLNSGDGTVSIMLQTTKAMKTRVDLRLSSSPISGGHALSSSSTIRTSTRRHLQFSASTTTSTGFSSVTVTIGPGVAPVGLSVVDLDGDGQMDIITTNPASGELIVLTNDGGSGYETTKAIPLTSGNIAAMATGDFNHDGFTGE